MKKLLDYKSKLNTLCYRLDVPTFEANEILYLEEYVKIMKPIAEAIDFLQSEQNMFFGYFLPTLVSIQVKLRRLDSQEVIFLSKANKEIQKSLIKRFEKYFLVEPEAWDAVIAAIVIPKIKLRFVKTLLETAVTHSEDEFRLKLNEYAREFKSDDNVNRCGTKSSNTKLSFLDFGKESEGNVLLLFSFQLNGLIFSLTL